MFCATTRRPMVNNDVYFVNSKLHVANDYTGKRFAAKLLLSMLFTETSYIRLSREM